VLFGEYVAGYEAVVSRGASASFLHSLQSLEVTVLMAIWRRRNCTCSRGRIRGSSSATSC
jgi:hypothetical protein